MTRAAITPEDIADAIVRLPRTLRAGLKMSIYDLASRTGYFEQHERVGEVMIRKRLGLAPDLVDEWIAYSEDKRVGSGWYFRIVSHGEYEVGNYGGATGQHHSSVYPDRLDACAKFVKQEMEAIRTR